MIGIRFALLIERLSILSRLGDGCTLPSTIVYESVNGDSCLVSDYLPFVVRTRPRQPPSICMFPYAAAITEPAAMLAHVLTYRRSNGAWHTLLTIDVEFNPLTPEPPLPERLRAFLTMSIVKYKNM